MKKITNTIIENIKLLFPQLVASMVLSGILILLFTQLGGYTLEESTPAIFSSLFIPFITLIGNTYLNTKLHEEDLLEKQLKQNEYFMEKGMITKEQYDKEKCRIKNKIQKSERYKM